MNLVDAFVKKVISGPYKEYGKWWIDVEYISWGVPGKTRLMFESKEQALEVKEGGLVDQIQSRILAPQPAGRA
ncbi:hypothetical protein CQF81_12090 [Salmonella enterica subsp. enterica serovar Typhimurium]|nr:hypothetical protein [Salmonella enterica subsp. enterica serovar Typhimurium]